MKKFAIIADTGCDIPEDDCCRLGISTLPLWIHFSDGSYRDLVDMKKEEFYNLLDKEIPKTSTPSPQEVEDAIKKELENGYESVLIITISSKLSGFNNLCNLMAEEYNGKVKVFDTKNVAMGAGFYAYRAAELRDDGATIDEVYGTLMEERDNMSSRTYFAIPDLSNLISGGRIGKVKGTIGQLLSIKPIISCDTEGYYYTVEKARGFVQAQKKLVNRVKKELLEAGECYLGVFHGDNKEAFVETKKALTDEISRAKTYVESQISPSLAVHTGRGLVGVIYYKIS